MWKSEKNALNTDFIQESRPITFYLRENNSFKPIKRTSKISKFGLAPKKSPKGPPLRDLSRIEIFEMCCHNKGSEQSWGVWMVLMPSIDIKLIIHEDSSP